MNPQVSSMEQTARKVYAEAFGGPEVLVVRRDEPVREPGPGEVRVRVRAAGLNPVDYKIFTGGEAAGRYATGPPFGNGNDYSGVIDAVGPGVEDWAVGDEVYGGARMHAQADFVVVGDLSTLNPLPAGLGHEQAAVLDIAARTALAGVEALGLNASDTVLISAAAGGVGLFASQLAVRTGARVLGVAGPRNHDVLVGWGVEPIGYGDGLEERVRAAAPGGVTAVLDFHGRESIELAIRLGVPRGRINSVADKPAAIELGGTTFGRADTSFEAVRPVAEAVARGELVVPVTGYDLDDVVEAYRELMTGHVTGKFVLRVSGPDDGSRRA